ncbi:MULTISPECIES: GumC family protein [Pseudomonadaceae]|uniref:Putative tyrosine-protein kinase epsB n=1 Tax=Ectopseudomonas oleovorans (strain CECT 5344) TaxID=1182590 RepID=W6RLB1_ECTO5|nr:MULTISPECIES: exopolysaccharide transport family protein [Pseudomonas]MDH0624103.1 exopolysaccharide transport family protein [Pseudomonas chengduensis]MDH1666374.1 exopolysaccharide transport family protein [Pseudomonas chengduensis]CDM42669.1 putative tyrosine-protein kinase epsB [Pseudomonas oleovorans CECT 5344]CDR93291.1 putative tyrosine-protein kinase epsB [Pseudomonas oleovorans]
MIEIRSFRDLLRLLFIFLREFKWAMGITLVVILLGAFLLPAKYESNARLLVKPGRDAALPLEISDRQAMVMPISQRDPIVDEERMLTGRPIVREVAEHYLEVLANQPPPPWVWKRIKYEVKRVVGAVIDGVRTVFETIGVIEEQTDVERLARALEKNFEVDHALGSSVMEIRFTWNEPDVAQAIVEHWIEIYQRQRTDALGRKSLFTFYEAQSAASALQIKSYKEQLLQKMTGLGAASITDRLEDLSERINILRGERFNTQRLISSSDSVLENTRNQLKGLPQEVVTVRQIALNPAQQDLRRLLNQKRLERVDMLRTYVTTAEPVRALDESIASLEKQVADEGDTVQSSEDRAPNTLSIHLQRVLLDETSNNKALRAQLAAQESQLHELEAQRNEAMREEPEVARLQRELDAAEKNYVLYTDSLEKSRIDRELDNSQISNIAVIEAATLNPARVFPKTLVMLLLALPFSALVGLLVVYVCYLLDQRIHDGGLVESRFGLPLWTTLPERNNSSAQTSNAFAASVYRLYGFMPLKRIASDGLMLGLTSARHGEGVGFVIEQMRQLLEENGLNVRVGGAEPAQPGEVVLLDASALLDSREAFVTLRRADMIALVVEARQSSIPVVQHVLSILTTAFGKVDGIIINRRCFEVPGKVLKVIDRFRGAF